MVRHLTKDKPTSKVYEVLDTDYIGTLLFSFNKKKIYNLFTDYPHNFHLKKKRYSIVNILID